MKPLSTRQQAILQMLDVSVWRQRCVSGPAEAAQPAPVITDQSSTPSQTPNNSSTTQLTAQATEHASNNSSAITQANAAQVDDESVTLHADVEAQEQAQEQTSVTNTGVIADAQPANDDLALDQKKDLAEEHSHTNEPINKAAAVSTNAAVVDRPTELGVLRRVVDQCQGCDLHRTRRHTVFGEGAAKSPWLFLGGAPGATDELAGKPLLDKAGLLFDAMLKAMNLTRQDIYLSNVIKCHPPADRAPEQIEVSACGKHLQQQLDILAPQVIVCLGALASQRLLETEDELEQLRGNVYKLGEAVLIASYHPEHLLAHPADKAKAWQDLCMARQIMDGLQRAD